MLSCIAGTGELTTYSFKTRPSNRVDVLDVLQGVEKVDHSEHAHGGTGPCPPTPAHHPSPNLSRHTAVQSLALWVSRGSSSHPLGFVVCLFFVGADVADMI